MQHDYKNGSVALMVRSGARGGMDQMAQLGGFRGVLTDMEMQDLEVPVWENYREGIAPLNFYLGSHGARRSMCEKKLKTAPAGELTRLMVEAAYDCVVRMEDCGTEKGVVFQPFPATERPPFKGLPGLGPRLVGRVETGSGQVIREDRAGDLERKGHPVSVRSPLTCMAHTVYGQGAVCGKCCGWDLSTRELPEKGLPTGILAAQSIGERGTQLTMRTFHTGGVGGSAITSGLDRVRAILSDRKVAVPIYIITDPRNSGWKAGEEVDVWTLLLGCKGLDQADLPEWEPADYALKKPKSKRPSDYLEQLDEFRTILAFEFHTIYKGAVDERHLEMILRGMLRWPEKDLPYLTSVYGAHLEKEGFLAGASFRSCVDVLVRAALEGREDKIRGSKERLMVGRRV